MNKAKVAALDQVGTEVPPANRVAMGRGRPPRLPAPYDAPMLP
jgi:hypothetical protein